MNSKGRKNARFGREPFNGYSHLLGSVLAYVGGIVLVHKTQGSLIMLFACAAYATSLFLAFFSSALFHLISAPPQANPTFTRL